MPQLRQQLRRKTSNQKPERFEMSELILSSVELVEHYLPKYAEFQRLVENITTALGIDTTQTIREVN